MKMEEALAQYKNDESVEDVMQLMNEKDPTSISLRKLAVAWPKIRVTVKDLKGAAPENVNELWTWLWQFCDYSLDELKRVSGVKVGIESLMQILIGNRIIYPDGTLSEYGKKAIRAIIKNELGM